MFGSIKPRSKPWPPLCESKWRSSSGADVRKVGIRKSLIEWGNGDCIFFHGESRTCQVYDARPRQCRTWPFWPSNLASPDTWADTAERCPGCNHGRLVPLESILRKSRRSEYS